ncbi:MAG: 2-alkenal reductase [Candidatus Moranbacteria bacterium GW2011_GWE1_49_15]|nr:MAG: 2-alkenal reductase [Candidatus Moranbacteria bacterium GW2011_GWE2_47_10]KKW06586.1 MAG: 2-alkenal reductase [Candidatus Moranbacteria bacterium GW2011_GWE1_49_15]
MDRYVVPRLGASQFFGKFSFFKEAAENVTIINKTEQVTVREDDSVNQIASRASTSVVNVISINSAKGTLGKDRKVRPDSMSGTGILATSDGVIITYRDVIFEDNATYAVLLYNNDKYDAKLIGVDEFANLAYLKIEASNLPSIDFANSDDFKPGKKLVSIGNSFSEYQNRFSAGLLSNINKTFNLSGKTVASSDKLEGVFETDFDNQENYLGGPVISYGGELVGINGKISIDNKDVYFQIPSNAIKKSLDRALNGELEKTPTIGAYYISITKEYSLSHNVKSDRGALIFSPSGNSALAFLDGSAAQKAGLRIGDIVLAVNGKNIDLSNPLSNLVNQYKEGDKLELIVLRAEEEMKIEIQL